VRKISDLDRIIRETALRKQRAAQMRSAGTPEGFEEPSTVYQAACAVIGQGLATEGFRYAKSGPRLTRKAAEFTHQVSFQSSHNNVRGEFIALWIHAIVLSRAVKAWRQGYDPQTSWDFVAGGQIGNLDPQPGWSEWNLADPQGRPAAIDDAIGTIRSTALPFFALFTDRSSALKTLDQWPKPGIEIVPAIELALSYDDRPRAQSLLKRFFDARQDLLPEYHAKLVEFRTSGLPPYRDTAYGAVLARATNTIWPLSDLGCRLTCA